MTPTEESTIVCQLFRHTHLPRTLAEDNLDTDELLGEIGYRLAHVIQMVTSLIALPILLFIGFFESAIRFSLCDGEGSKAALSTTVKVLPSTLIYFIPASILTCITPLNLGSSLDKSLLECSKGITDSCEFNVSSDEDKASLDFQGDDEHSRLGNSEDGEFSFF